ncbi:MAG: serine/threonine-protein kinase [Coleofasciculus sp. C1-SOL-03]|uniref:serine/threonine protein kinase n=1 Tax=Coleofasciculus sp. C1-SOL-03 TaxID=3069522 RepID=UPI0032F23133
MSHFPDFSHYGYQINQELGHNTTGGRVTYLANPISPEQQNTQVVIKQFQFAQIGASWTDYESHQQEIKMLRHLNHSGIPRYLDSFQTEVGFCMVQEYIPAKSLSETSRWTPQQIKQLALSVLTILVYLQDQTPTVIHRDIKPENILIDDQNQVYLVDFGFARIGDGDVGMSSVVKGTLGFMPPEQLFNRQLSAASDLYGLGVTLICLLTGTKSTDVGNLMDSNYRLHFRHLVPPLQRGWLNWLEKMVEPKPHDRYEEAADAIAALKPIDVSRLPKVRLERDYLEFSASEYGEKLSQSISVSNPIPDTILSGWWEVAPHPSDPPHTPYHHAWISFEPEKFEGNQVECKITVDTRKLMADATYTRQIILHTNSDPDTHAIVMQLHTAPITRLPQNAFSLIKRFGGHICISFVLAFSVVVSMALTFSSITESAILWSWSLFYGLVLFMGIEFDIRNFLSKTLIQKGIPEKQATSVGLLFRGLGFFWIFWLMAGFGSTVNLNLVGNFINIEPGFPPSFLIPSFVEPLEFAAVAGVAFLQLVGIPFLLLYYLYLRPNYSRLIVHYRQHQEHLIKP